MAETGISEKEMVLILSTVFMVTQIIYFMISKNSTDKILKGLSELNKSIQSEFSEHNDVALKTNKIIAALYDQHDVKDVDGRPLWYTPHSLGNTQKEILTISLEIARICGETTAAQKELRSDIAQSLGRIETKLETHQDACKTQYHALEKEIVETSRESRA